MLDLQIDVGQVTAGQRMKPGGKNPNSDTPRTPRVSYNVTDKKIEAWREKSQFVPRAYQLLFFPKASSEGEL